MGNEIVTPAIVLEFQQSGAAKLVVKDDLLTVTVVGPALEHSQWRGFASGCHQLAGELGVGIEFVTC